MNTMETTMKMNEITWNHSWRSNGNHLANLLLDRVDWSRFRSFAEDHADVEIIHADVDADYVVVQCGCRSPEVACRLEDAWN